jgi:hypothetical protein
VAEPSLHRLDAGNLLTAQPQRQADGLRQGRSIGAQGKYDSARRRLLSCAGRLG